MKSTTLCYLENDRGEYLLMHRVKKAQDVNSGKWVGVGGKLEGTESPDQCLVREVWEETGLTLSGFRFHGVVTFLSDAWEGEYMYLFTARRWTGTLRAGCPEGDLEWIPKGRVGELPIWEGDRIFLRLIEEDRPAFLLTLEYRGNDLVRAELDGRQLPVEGGRLSGHP